MSKTKARGTAESTRPDDGDVVAAAGVNLVVLAGELSSDPVERVLPSGDRLVSFEVTSRVAEGSAESAPVVWIDPPTSASGLTKGTAVVVWGRVRRRFFRAGGITQSRTEVVAERIVPAGQRRRVDTLVRRARRALDRIG
jgi:single-strand DNA-binding protein